MAVSHAKSQTGADFTGTVTVHNSQGSTATIAATDLIRPSDWNSGHNQLYTLSGNTTGNSTASGTNVIFEGHGPVVLGGTSNSLQFNLRSWDRTLFYPWVHANEVTFSAGHNSVYVVPFRLDYDMSANCIKIPGFCTNSSSAIASARRGLTILFGVYTRHSTNNTVLSQLYSTSYTLAASHSSNASWALSMITAVGNSTSYNTTTSSSAGVNLSSLLHGARDLILPFSSTLSAGEYWFCLHNSTSSGAGGAGNILNWQNYGWNKAIPTPVGFATTATNVDRFLGGLLPMGTYSTTTGALPASINFTQVNSHNSLPYVYWGPETV